MISPIILVIGGLGIWYCTKKEPNPQKMKISVVATVIGLFGCIILLGSGGSDSEFNADNNANTSTAKQTEKAEVAEPETASSESVIAEVAAPEAASSESVIIEEPVATVPSEPVVAPAPAPAAAPEVSREFRNALGSANDYLNYTSFSKSGLYDQLYMKDFLKMQYNTLSIMW